MDQQTALTQSGAARAGNANANATNATNTTKPKRKIVDWISEPRQVQLTPFQQFTVSVDWEASRLGPMSGWSKQLRSMVLLCFADPKPVSFPFDLWLH